MGQIKSEDFVLCDNGFYYDECCTTMYVYRSLLLKMTAVLTGLDLREVTQRFLVCCLRFSGHVEIVVSPPHIDVGTNVILLYTKQQITLIMCHF